MATNKNIDNPSDDDKPKSNIERRRLLNPLTYEKVPLTFKPFPPSIIQSIENQRRQRLPQSRSAIDFHTIQQSSIDTTDDDIDDNYETTTTTTTTTTNSSRKRLLNAKNFPRIPPLPPPPPDIRITLYSSTETANKLLSGKASSSRSELHSSDPSIIEIKSSKQRSTDFLRRPSPDYRLNRQKRTSVSSSRSIRSINRRRSTPSFMHRAHRRSTSHLPRNSKWHFVRNHLHDIAMMSHSYARIKLVERDLRWVKLREEVCKHVLDMREMSILRQQDDGRLKKAKTSFDLKTMPKNEVVHVDHDGQIFSLDIRDLVLGHSIQDKHVPLDAFAQFQARRKLQVKQDLLKQQEGRTRLKKQIAFLFCLCNLSFIVFMFAAMFIFATTTIVELRSREFF